MQPPGQKEIRVEKFHASFLIVGWILALLVLVGGIGGGVWFWRRAKATSEQVRAKVAKEIQARKQPAVVPDEAVPLDQPSDDRAQEPRPIPSGPEGSIGKRSRVLPRPPTGAEGKLNHLSVQRIVRSHMGEMKMCYEAELKQQPELSGRVTVYFVVGSNGQVSSTKVTSSTLRNAKVEKCLLQAIRNWKFPPPMYKDSEGISVPFVFNP